MLMFGVTRAFILVLVVIGFYEVVDLGRMLGNYDWLLSMLLV